MQEAAVHLVLSEYIVVLLGAGAAILAYLEAFEGGKAPCVAVAVFVVGGVVVVVPVFVVGEIAFV